MREMRKLILKNLMCRLSLILIIINFIFIVGCEQQSSEVEQLEVIDIGNGTQITTTESASQAVQVNSTQSSVEQTDLTGGYSLELNNGAVTLSANGASRMTIINEIASQIDMKVAASNSADKLISTKQRSVTVDAVLREILNDINYRTGYRDTPNEMGFRINNLVVGSQSNERSSAASDGNSADGTSIEFGLPPAAGEINLGSEPEEIELVQRLQFGAAEDRAIAVSELMMDPLGFDAAYKIFARDESPDVRLAVLELIESEDYFVARQMVVSALQDQNKQVVLYALGIIDSHGDFTLAPQVEALTNHFDTEVVEYAKEVRESLTEGYFDLNE